MEGDIVRRVPTTAAAYFNPLPPYGGRLNGIDTRNSGHCISIHSLRMEGDLMYGS